MNRPNQTVLTLVPIDCVQYNRKDDRVLGQGAYGRVYQKALSSSLNTIEKVAVKRIQIIDIDPSRDEEKELLEIESMKKFDHPNVLNLHCALEDRDFKYIRLHFTAFYTHFNSLKLGIWCWSCATPLFLTIAKGITDSLMVPN